jgi:hypothetical protein
MRRRGIGALLLILAVGALPAGAAEMRTVEAGAFVGACFGDGTAGVDDDAVYGVRLGVFLTRAQALELVYDRVNTTFASPSFGALDEDFTSIAVHWMFNFPNRNGPFAPYLFVGMGEIEDEVVLAGSTTADDDIYFPWGGGFRVLASEHVGVRLEVRRKDFTTFEVDNDSWELTVGVTFPLGRYR